MNTSTRTITSPYMRWAKSHFHAKYNLANSGLTDYPLSRLPVMLEELKLTGSSYYGYEPLQEEIGKRYGVGSEKIFFTLGTSYANFMVLSVLFEAGAEILIEHPTYELIVSTARYLGYTIKRFNRRIEDGFRIDPAIIKKEISPKTKLIVITNLHNPSSVLTDDASLREIGTIAESSGAFVCVDEVYLDAVFHRTPRSAVHLGDNFLVTNSLTKVYGISGLRSGWVLAEPALIQKMWYLNDLMYVKHVHLAEQLSLIAFQNLEKIKAWSADILIKNHRLTNGFLDSHANLKTIRPGLGTVVFPQLLDGSVEKLSQLLRDKYDTAITPGIYFDMPAHFRVGLGCEPHIFAEGINRLDQALKELSL